MTDPDLRADAAEPSVRSSNMTSRLIVVLVVVAFAGIILFKSFGTPQQAAPPDPTAASQYTTSTAPASITSVHNDAVADYDAAAKTGKPVYVLFHSLS